MRPVPTYPSFEEGHAAPTNEKQRYLAARRGVVKQLRCIVFHDPPGCAVHKVALLFLDRRSRPSSKEGYGRTGLTVVDYSIKTSPALAYDRAGRDHCFGVLGTVGARRSFSFVFKSTFNSLNFPLCN